MSKEVKISSMQALPLFQIITPNFRKPSTEATRKMSANEIPTKPRRKKKGVVPVHKGCKNEEGVSETPRKVYSAQFNSKRRIKQRNVESNEPQGQTDKKERQHSYDRDDSNLDLIETDRSTHRIRRKSLIDANERLHAKNQELSEKLNENEEYFNKKLLKLKEKLNAIQKFNEDIVQENNIIKNQYKDLLTNLEVCKLQLENSKNCRSCEELKKALEKSNSDNNLLNISNKQLYEDIDMLKNVVYRLNVQMERYQDKLRKNNVTVKCSTINQTAESGSNIEVITKESITTLPESHLDHPHVPISWGKVNAHTLGPLLDAYQETITEKEEIIQNYESELSYFTGKLQEIMNENEKLHKCLTEDDECSAKLSVELDKAKNELKSIKEQNDLLIKKCSLKQDKLEEVLQCYEQKVEQMRRDYNVVVEQYHKSRSEVSTLKEKNKSLVDSQDEFKNERQNYIPVSVHTASVNECKKWYEELKHQYEQEKMKMKEKVASLHNQIGELSNNITVLTTEKEDLQNKAKLHEKQIRKAEGKYLDLQHVLQEVQLSRTACRKQLHKAMEFAKELVTEQESLLKALHHRQQENKAVKQIGSDIATRMDSLKNQLKTVQRDAFHELSTVEQRLQDQDSMIMSMKREHDEEVERLKQIIKQKEASNLLLRDTNSSIPMPHYLLLKNRNIN